MPALSTWSKYDFDVMLYHILIFFEAKIVRDTSITQHISSPLFKIYLNIRENTEDRNDFKINFE